MGKGQSKEILKASPLGFVLTYWKEIAGTGGIESRKTTKVQWLVMALV